MIIAAFSGVGKTYFCNHVENAKDFVCMPYKYFLNGIISHRIKIRKNKTTYTVARFSELKEIDDV